MTFRDRAEAGAALGPLVRRLGLRDPLALGIGPGGLVVAAELAGKLGADLDLLIVSEIDVEDANHPPIQVGALKAGGEVVLHDEEAARLSPQPGRLDRAVEKARAELARLDTLYREGSAHPPVSGRDAIVVDDGTSTRGALRAAVEIVRKDGARTVVVAIPAAPPETLSEVAAVADEVVCAEPLPWYTWFRLHGHFYEDESIPEAQEVRRLLSPVPPPG